MSVNGGVITQTMEYSHNRILGSLQNELADQHILTEKDFLDI